MIPCRRASICKRRFFFSFSRELILCECSYNDNSALELSIERMEMEMSLERVDEMGLCLYDDWQLIIEME